MSNEHERGGQQLFRVLAGRSQREGTVSDDLGNSGDCEHGAGRFVFLFFRADVRSGWSWNDSGAKSVGGQPMIRIASIQYGVGVDSDIWFDSNGLGLGNTHPGSWYKAHKTTLLFTRRKKITQKIRDLGNRGVSGFLLWGGSVFPCLSATGGFHTGRLRRRSSSLAFPALDCFWDTGTVRAIMRFRDSFSTRKRRGKLDRIKRGGFGRERCGLDHQHGFALETDRMGLFFLHSFVLARTLRSG
ncbi:hypothetical protein CABS01_03453 [Colletotrichum abscissum]|uniref:Uncharacterized protein n=1 Tax=Colletotrichum abscissum TaxID=1671311 RepID=A0A9P9X6Z9_9PEZI|nr:uncharacterized protein CABS01_03453 [Colletotrichum abscissum]KAI3540431.1 hypothetical protein CABS02_11038 [Colletotrichum abscissum]KAK1478151.1 hypothetical protein CABS01_03453 [Colletotrichum abscissum]